MNGNINAELLVTDLTANKDHHFIFKTFIRFLGFDCHARKYMSINLGHTNKILINLMNTYTRLDFKFIGQPK